MHTTHKNINQPSLNPAAMMIGHCGDEGRPKIHQPSPKTSTSPCRKIHQLSPQDISTIATRSIHLRHKIHQPPPHDLPSIAEVSQSPPIIAKIPTNHHQIISTNRRHKIYQSSPQYPKIIATRSKNHRHEIQQRPPPDQPTVARRSTNRRH